MSARAMVAAITGTVEASPPGVVTGVHWQGERDVAAWGVCGSDHVPVTPDTLFDLASVTKVVATTCALHRLAVLGHLDLDDPVRRYLPDLPFADAVTLTTLLTHRSGLWEWQPLYLAGDEPRRVIERLPLRYPQGAARHYSDLGFMLLGDVLSRVTGLAIDEAVAELVTGPLGLQHTRFGPVDGPVAASSRGDEVERLMVATGEPYPVQFDDPRFPWRDHELQGEVNDGNCHHAFGGVAGHAGLFSTVGDLLDLMTSLASTDTHVWGDRVADTVFADGPDAGQALGWRSLVVDLEGRPRRLLWHAGFTGTGVGFIPGAGFGAVLLSNRLLAQRPPTTTSTEQWLTALSAVESLGFDHAPEGMIR